MANNNSNMKHLCGIQNASSLQEIFLSVVSRSLGGGCRPTFQRRKLRLMEVRRLAAGEVTSEPLASSIDMYTTNQARSTQQGSSDCPRQAGNRKGGGSRFH